MALPKNPVPGKIYRKKDPKTKKTVCFMATGKKGFGAWKIVKCPK